MIQIEVDKVKKQLAEKLSEEYGSVAGFSRHPDAVTLGIEKSVRQTLSVGTGNTSIRVLNILLKKYEMPILHKKVEQVRKVTYHQKV